MYEVDRHRFVPPELVGEAYLDRPLPIGAGQTISQPFMVAKMAQTADIRRSDRILEIGTGSGYGAAVLSRLAAGVWSIERIEELAERSAAVLAELGYDNVTVRTGDGTKGWPEQAPFDVIVVTAAGPHVPQELLAQLAENGRLVAPIGGQATDQRLVRVVRSEHGFATTDIGAVRFVPLISDTSDGEYQ